MSSPQPLIARPPGLGWRTPNDVRFIQDACACGAENGPHENAELQQLSGAGCDDVIMFPCLGGLEQVSLLARALRADGAVPGARGVL
jgi:hypothetical protein